jgi:uncharacterized protein (UPF0128 family)
MSLALSKKWSLLLLLLVCSCSHIKHLSNYSNTPSVAQSMTPFYFSVLFLDSPEVNIQQQVCKLSKDYTWENVTSGILHCRYRHKTESETNRGEVTCQYLGTWRGLDIIYRQYWIIKVGLFSDIIFCSVSDGILRVHKKVLSGKLVADWVHSPIFDGKGKIYCHVTLSNATVLEQAGLGDDIASGPDGHTSDGHDWAIAQCEYDIAREKMQILSMVAFSEGPAKAKTRDFNKNEKIMSLVRQKAHGGVAIYNKKEVQEFLRNLREMY